VAVGLPRLALDDEPGVLGEPGGVEEQRDVVPVADLADRPQVPSETGWPPPELLVTVTITSGTRRADARDRRLERLDVEVALERGRRRCRSRASGRIRSRASRALVLDVGAGGVEVGVVRHHVAGSRRLSPEQDALGGAPLVGRDHVREAGELLDHLSKRWKERAPA
jgi:hypothetical protein